MDKNVIHVHINDKNVIHVHTNYSKGAGLCVEIYQAI